MTWFIIEPSDVWMFRTGQPFAAGEGHTARSQFPPSALTVQGALRAAISASQGVSLSAYRDQSSAAATEVAAQIGGPGQNQLDLGKLRLRGPHLVHWNSDGLRRFFRVPADVVVYGDAVSMLSPVRQAGAVTDTRLLPLNMPTTNVKPTDTAHYWMSGDQLDRYLDNRLEQQAKFYASDNLFTSEYRFGIGVDAGTRTAVEGMLYNAEFIRMKPNTGLLVEVNGVDSKYLPPDWIQNFGGEGRSATLQQVIDLPPTPMQIVAPEQFKIVFLTPAYFSGGWQPLKEDTGWSRLLGRAVKLISAAVPGYTAIGGWNSQTRLPRQTHRYVPAGSVYYFESAGADLSPINTLVSESPDDIADATALGFGEIAVASWSYSS